MEDSRSEDPRNDPARISSPPSHRPLTLDDLLEVGTFSPLRSVALSPEGRYVAYATQRSGDVCFRHPVSRQGVPLPWEACRLTVLDTEDGALTPLAPGTFSAWTPVWSPDGQRLTFLTAEHREGPVELWMWEPGGGAARPVTPRPVQPHGIPRWFPDGRRMCVPLVPAGGGTAPAPDAGRGRRVRLPGA